MYLYILEIPVCKSEQYSRVSHVYLETVSKAKADCYCEVTPEQTDGGSFKNGNENQSSDLEDYPSKEQPDKKLKLRYVDVGAIINSDNLFVVNDKRLSSVNEKFVESVYNLTTVEVLYHQNHSFANTGLCLEIGGKWFRSRKEHCLQLTTTYYFVPYMFFFLKSQCVVFSMSTYLFRQRQGDSYTSLLNSISIRQ